MRDDSAANGGERGAMALIRRYHRSMATVRISEAEAAKDFAGLLERVRAGEEVVIENGSSPEVILSASTRRPGRLLSESLRIARENGFTATLDGGFGRDVEEFINSHQEPLDCPWD